MNMYTRWPNGQKKCFLVFSEESPFPLDALSLGQITTTLDSFYRLSLGDSQTLHDFIYFSACFLSHFSLEGRLPQGLSLP